MVDQRVWSAHLTQAGQVDVLVLTQAGQVDVQVLTQAG